MTDFKPTEANLKWLRRANKAGLIEWTGVGGIMRNNWHNMMQRLAAHGLVTPYPHGHTYEITEAGKRAVAQAQSKGPR
jgi:DNA-binding IclR family transcriptional regulator